MLELQREQTQIYFNSQPLICYNLICRFFASKPENFPGHIVHLNKCSFEVSYLENFFLQSQQSCSGHMITNLFLQFPSCLFLYW